jgi:hypothetical protein
MPASQCCGYLWARGVLLEDVAEHVEPVGKALEASHWLMPSRR